MWRPDDWEKIKPKTTQWLGNLAINAEHSIADTDDIFQAGVEAGADAVIIKIAYLMEQTAKGFLRKYIDD